MPSPRFSIFSRRSFDLISDTTGPEGLHETKEEAIIPHVSVITEGPAESHFVKPTSGPDAGKEFQIYIDQTTLDQVVAAAGKYKAGVKVKADHDSGIQNVIGCLKDFKIGETPEGKKRVEADFHLFKNSPLFDHALNLLKTIPDAIGFSAYFDVRHPGRRQGREEPRGCRDPYEFQTHRLSTMPDGRNDPFRDVGLAGAVPENQYWCFVRPEGNTKGVPGLPAEVEWQHSAWWCGCGPPALSTSRIWQACGN